MKIGLDRINMQEVVTVEALLDSGATGLVISLKFTRKQRFKLKKIENPIYIRNVDETFNKEGSIENMVEVNIYYQRQRKDGNRYDRETKVECDFENAVACLSQS